jgi:prophage regulatory protein
VQPQETGGRLLPITKVIDKTSKSRSSIYEDVRAGTFPKPVRIGPNRIAWPEAAVDSWIASRVEAA